MAREESISGAAKALHLSQPTLSRQLMDLEAELGKTLFIRGSRRVTLTEQGTLLRKRAGEILDLVEKTTGDLTVADDAVAGEIYIDGGESNALRLLAQTTQQFRAANPHVQFHLFSGNAVDVGERLEKGLLDFGVMMRHRDTKKYDCIKLSAVLLASRKIYQQESSSRDDSFICRKGVFAYGKKPIEKLNVLSDELGNLVFVFV